MVDPGYASAAMDAARFSCVPRASRQRLVSRVQTLTNKPADKERGRSSHMQGQYRTEL